ncbi:ribonuclease H family protein [Caldifermentibacillus hisashii]|uniref:ribonuclease H family protein n=1 Tax=Caldifermentibacillus hisashii TaxID=996558 RepID=UPI003100B9B1
MATKKYYVVWKGANTGIFTSWDDCKRNVQGVPGAKYKSFSSMKEAEIAFQKGWEAYYGQNKKSDRETKGSLPTNNLHHHDYIEDSIAVDAACSGNPGPMEYKGVCLKTGQTLFHFGPIVGTNNIGEFLAIVHALGFLQKKNLSIPIYSDSQTAIKWVKMKKANTNLPLTKETEQVWNLIKRAEQWLQTHFYANPIIKWETKLWGENKADFGRK